MSPDIATPLTSIVVSGVAFAPSPSRMRLPDSTLHGATGQPWWHSEETITTPLSGRIFGSDRHGFVGTRDSTVYAFGFAMQRK